MFAPPDMSNVDSPRLRSPAGLPSPRSEGRTCTNPNLQLALRKRSDARNPFGIVLPLCDDPVASGKVVSDPAFATMLFPKGLPQVSTEPS